MRDLLVIALERLVNREGGRAAVADEIGSSEQTLYQIIKGIKDSRTGTPKSVGPNLRKRLDERYPGWRELASVETPPTLRAEPTPVRAITRYMEALDPVLAPSAREVLHRLIDGRIDAAGATDSLDRLLALSHSDVNKLMKTNRSSLDLPSEPTPARTMKFVAK